MTGEACHLLVGFNCSHASANSWTLPPSAVEQTHKGSCATSRALNSRHHPELIGVTLSNTPCGKVHMTTLGHNCLRQQCKKFNSYQKP